MELFDTMLVAVEKADDVMAIADTLREESSYHSGWQVAYHELDRTLLSGQSTLR